MSVRLKAVEKAGEAGPGSWVLHFCGDVRVSPAGTNELLVKCIKINLLFSTDGHAPCWHLRTGFVLDDDRQSSSLAGMKRSYFHGGNGSDFL